MWSRRGCSYPGVRVRVEFSAKVSNNDRCSVIDGIKGRDSSCEILNGR
jgi:hypothetical protein